MYYFLPKAAEKPVYSYRLSIVHFWSLVFIYIWAGPHHLLYTTLPEWAQTLGMLFSLMLWAPSWGGMINGLLTLRGAWDRVRTDVVLKMFVVGLTFYGMATFEGPLLSIKSVSAVAHYTDWIIGHVHAGALGWNCFMTFAMVYWLVPRLWNTKLYSERLANAHFWLGLTGIILYYVSMITAGITQGLMWRAVDSTGHLVYPDFVETVTKIVPLYWVRAGGGSLFLLGFILMLYNVYRTVKAAPKTLTEPVQSAPALRLAGALLTEEGALREKPHRLLEGMPAIFATLSFVAVLVGTVIELVPALFANDYVQAKADLKPYTSLQVAGRDIYVREGCYLCHSQMIRPIPSETLRYGAPSRPEESMYDHPFQWGSKRIGPDLARVGGKYPDVWHYRHMNDPRDLVPGSIMPTYPWLFRDKIDFAILNRKLSVLSSVSVPYDKRAIEHAELDARSEAHEIAERLKSQGAADGLEDKEIVALIAYLQRLGADFKKGLIQ
jgi:cytochrome c oxidase cbb3-type subunit I/II